MIFEILLPHEVENKSHSKNSENQIEKQNILDCTAYFAFSSEIGGTVIGSEEWKDTHAENIDAPVVEPPPSQ